MQFNVGGKAVSRFNQTVNYTDTFCSYIRAVSSAPSVAASRVLTRPGIGASAKRQWRGASPQL